MELNLSQAIMCRMVDLSDKRCPDSDCIYSNHMNDEMEL